MNTTAYFDPSNPDTPANRSPAVAMANISGIPSSGTGLTGAAFVPGTNIWNIELARAAANGTADATFISTELVYGSRKSDTTIAEFLGDDGGSVEGNGDLEMGPSALTFSGYIYIPPGVHEIKVYSDDGFDLNIGGVDFSDFPSGRSADDTARVAEFEGGLYSFDMLYFDGGGRMALGLEIDGLPVDQSAFYGRRGEQGDTENDVAELADRGVGQPGFEIVFGEGDHRRGRGTMRRSAPDPSSSRCRTASAWSCRPDGGRPGLR